MKRIFLSFIVCSIFLSKLLAQGQDCVNAVFVSSNGCNGVGQFNNTNITGTLSNPSCFTTGTNNGMWFYFVASSPVVNITINGSTLSSPQLSLLEPPPTGCASNATFTELACATSTTSSVSLS